ncbi:hypothetical protein [Natronococcus roseus]|uniref:hypothetical protein n=1 Tax=Natronococcus roseus TaxID=1052014 RepID=UPI00374D2208
MVARLLYPVVAAGLHTSGWLQDGRQYEAPLRPDRLLWIDPTAVVHKPVTKPASGRLPPTLVAGGDWDLDLAPIEDDIVYRAFHDRFVEERLWDETGYIEFLADDVSEHGDRSRAEARERCRDLDALYQYIAEHGYKPQAQLEREGALLDGLSGSLRPPTYREIAVDVTREGEFVWHAGMHRLVIAQLLELEEIPVRVNTRHAQWQAIRDAAANGDEIHQNETHPDLEYLST